jgi:TetR/AcrR family transcriptional repressor of nem operon
MRYKPQHKAETHKRIVKDAARRFRGEGLTGAGVANVMRDTGLTHGGFYKHFRDKNDLLVESIGEAFREMGARLVRAAEQSAPGAAWKAVVREYLALDHCDRPEEGCPMAALAPEMARSNPGVKKRIVGEIVSYKDQLVRWMPGRRLGDRERAFFVIFSTMIGAIEIARMLPEPAARRRILTTTRDFLLQSFS